MNPDHLLAGLDKLGAIPPEWMTVIIASLPISELRGAIPLAIFKFGFSIPKAFLLSCLGNFIPVIPTLLLISPVSVFLRKIRMFDRFFNWWFERTRRHSEAVEKYEALGLFLFVAIPLPMTGAWSGCIAAYLFNIHFKYALPAVTAGILGAGVLVSLASAGILSIF